MNPRAPAEQAGATVGQRPRTTYRSEIRRSAANQGPRTYYDGGDLTPYSIDSLMDLVRCEGHLPHDSLDVLIDISGPCSEAMLRETARRFTSLGLRRLRVRIRALGLPIVLVGSGVTSARRG